MASKEIDMTVIDLTERVERELTDFDPCPCGDCQVGFASVRQWRDVETGRLMQESIDCFDSCVALSTWRDRQYLAQGVAQEPYSFSYSPVATHYIRKAEHKALMEEGLTGYSNIWQELADK